MSDVFATFFAIGSSISLAFVVFGLLPSVLIYKKFLKRG